MWGKVPKTVKCPRNDCQFFLTASDKQPCCWCTCSSAGDSFGRTFQYIRRNEDAGKALNNGEHKKNPDRPD